MIRMSLAAFALLSAIPAFAQSDTDILPCSEIQHAGRYVISTGQLFPPGMVSSSVTDPQVIYNNTCATPSFTSLLSDSVLIDDGRIPSSTSPAPNAGTRQSYLVTEFEFAYCTRELDVSLGGPGATVRARFFQDYDDCADLVTAGVPQGDFLISGLPGSTAVGTLACWIVTIDLTGGNEFCMMADADGTYDGSETLDGFGYALQMPGQTGTTTATSGGFILAGDVTPPGDCAEGDGTYYKNPGVATGTGLDNDDLLRREGSGTQTSGCIFFGGPPNVHAGLYMLITADLDDCSCTPNDTDGDGVTDCDDQCPGEPDVDSDGDGLVDCLDNCPDVANPGQEDCNGDGVGDACQIASGQSLDIDLNGVPDECQAGAGTPYCFGDGSGTACPCGNSGEAGSGCANSTGLGALTYNFGGASVSAADTALFTVRTPSNQVGLYLMGSSQLAGGLGVAIFDGLVCTGGVSVRFPAQFTGLQGVMDLLDPAATFPAEIVPGSTWNFAAWFRDPVGGPCGTGANFSNAVQIDFLP
jgi:hypothetical protein